ncbi:MAG: YfhO family protein [Planctomycetaceae bacterium]|jgi:hypothetical protein|nr:YfhO family protein [Planctomycetaceae bacterium]
MSSSTDNPSSSQNGLFPLLKRIPAWFVLAVIILTALFFWGVIFQGEAIGFRDGAHFFPALFEYIQLEWRQGRAPLWNPYENIGQPLQANPVASAFYPGKLVYFLPISSFCAYHLYVVGHLLLAAITFYRLARHWRISTYAATLGAISYVFGGSVLFQYSNVVFLLGAAWLPEAICQADKLFITRRVAPMITLGVVFAMFVLGGDPQTAYHAAILILLLAFFYYRNRKPPFADARLSLQTHSVLQMLENTASSSGAFPVALYDAAGFPKRSYWFHPLILFCGALTVGAVLSAVQWLPSLEFRANSDRILEDRPVSVWGIGAELERGYREHDHQAWNNIRNGILCRSKPQSGIAGIRYNYSVGPWRLSEWIFPNANGRNFPVNTNWGNAVGQKWSAAELWVPSLYMGILPFLLAISAVRFRKSHPVTLWLSWSGLIFLLGSFGYFGLGWIVNQILVLCGQSSGASGVGDPFGGVYWLMTLLIPGYSQFRYPAKLLTVVSLMLAMLAARNFDAAFRIPDIADTIHNAEIQRRRRRIALLRLGQGLVLISLLLIPLVLISGFWVWLARHIPDHPVFGAFQPDRALGEAAFSLMHVLNALFLFFAAVRIYLRHVQKLEVSQQQISLEKQSQKYRRFFARFGIAVIVLTGCDLLLSNLWMVGTIPRRIFENRPPLAAMMTSNNSGKSPNIPQRIWRAPTYATSSVGTRIWLPSAFLSPSQNRLAEWAAWERSTLSPRYPLPMRIGVTDVRGTIVTADYYVITHLLRDAWRNPAARENGTFSLPRYLETLGNSLMIAPRQNDWENPHSADLGIPPEKRLGKSFPQTAWNDDWASEFCGEFELWSLHETPRVTVADRFVLEKPLTFYSREAFFSKTYAILSKSQRTEIPVVEWGGERFDSLPTRFASAFIKLAALGDITSQRNRPTRREHDFSPHFSESSFRPHESPPAGTAKITAYEPQKVIVRATIRRPGLLILHDQYDKNWHAEVRAVPRPEQEKQLEREQTFQKPHPPKPPAWTAPILRTNRVLRGVALPEGEWEITFVYDPFSFRLGATVSFFAWAGLMMFLTGVVGRRWKAKR